MESYIFWGFVVLCILIYNIYKIKKNVEYECKHDYDIIDEFDNDLKSWDEGSGTSITLKNKTYVCKCTKCGDLYSYDTNNQDVEIINK